MKIIGFITILLVLITSCGVENKNPPAAPPANPTKAIDNTELLMTDSSQLRVYTYRYKFSVERLEDDRLRAIHNGEIVGKYNCLEFDGDFCTIEHYDFNFVDRSDHFLGQATVTRKKELVSIKLKEIDRDGSVDTFDYALASFSKIETNNKVNYSLHFENYQYRFGIRDKFFAKKMKLAQGSSSYLMVSGKIPNRSSWDNPIFTDLFRDGYRSQQSPDLTTNIYFENNTIFKGEEKTHEYGSKQRDIELEADSLKDLLNL